MQIKPKKRLGQNFLRSSKAIETIMNEADISQNDVILEIGPGLGVLTKELVKKAKKVIAIEKDKEMIEELNKTLPPFDNLEIVHGDALKKELKLPKNYKIIANLPFYITAPFIRKYLEITSPAGGPPQEMLLIVQKEVAQRICATPPDMNILALSVQFYALPKIIEYIKKGSFWPTPKVDSAIIKITPQHNIKNDLFFKIVKAGFSHPRKQLHGNLSKELKIDKKEVEVWLLQNNINPTQRAETLSLKDWLNITKTTPK